MQVKRVTSDPRIFVVGDFLFEPSVGLISSAGGAHRVCVETSTLLLYLVEHNDEFVSRERLLAELWDDAQGAERALTGGIERLRHYFDDTSETPRYIATSPSGGYRLVAPVYGDDGQPVARADVQSRGGSSGSRRIAGFIVELRDRKVCRALLLYTIAVWMIVQISEIIAPALALPAWFTTFVVVVGILGVPIAALLAWVFEIKPEGIVVDLPRQSAPHVRAPRNRLELVIDTTMIAAAALLSGHIFVNTFSGNVLASPGTVATNVAGDEFEAQPHRIAVSPLSVGVASAEAQAVAHLFVDRIIRSLLKREGLIVVWRDSAPSTTPLQPEQRIDSIVKGFVFEDGDRVSISVYLLDARSNTYLLSRVLPAFRLDEEELEREVEATTQEILSVIIGDVASDDDSQRYARVPDPQGS
jgi:DNA-binding winged helix-turn-helix (wHTH) protein/TolB-like protein